MKQFIPIWIAYFFAAASPGPAAVFVIESTSFGARKLGRLAALGVSLGSWVWVTLVCFGLGQVVRKVPVAAVAMRYASILLLGYFLYRTCLALFKRKAPESAHGIELRSNGSETFLKGFMVNLLNPNSVIFFLSLFAPMLVEAQSTKELSICVIGVTLISLLWYQLLVSFVGHPLIQSFLQRSERTFRAGFGLLYLYFLIRLLQKLTEG